MQTSPLNRRLLLAAAGAAIALSGQTYAGAALPELSFALSTKIDAAGLGEAQLLPAGEFAARDGRPGPGKKWRLGDAEGRALAARINATAGATPLVIDYEHQTLTASEKGHPAPAAGWISRTEWRDGIGLFATVKWTPRAKSYIEAGEYLYISPVITANEADQVTGVLMGALVNYPALLGMEAAVAALSSLSTRHHIDPKSHQEPSDMNREALCALLGLAATATDAQINAAITALSGELPNLRAALTEVAALKARPLLPAAVASALGVAPTADETVALSAVATLRTATGAGDANALAAIAALQGQLAALQAKVGGSEVATLVSQAVTDKKLLPAMTAWATDLGNKDLTALKAFISAAPALDGLSGQSNGQERGQGDATQTTALAGQVMAAFGLSADQFAKGAKQAA